MALCKYPIHLKKAGGIVPCGQCFTCRLNKARFWTFRIMMEAMSHEKTLWTGLSYSDKFLPKSYFDPNSGQIFEGDASSFSTLHPEDVELFLKRVRKKLPPRSFRFFLAGEYGGQTVRPHYHICIFGHDESILPILQRAWSCPVTKEPYGFVDNKHHGPITLENARYTAKYTLKKLTKSDDPRLEGRYPEFIRSSKGIGVSFAKRFADALRNQSGFHHIMATGDIPRSVRFNGRNWPLDRYLRDKILEELGITEVLLENGKKRFQNEMSALSLRAELNPKFKAAGQITPYVLEKQYQEENRQKVLNTEKRAKLFMKET